MGDIGATKEEVEGSTKTTTLITIKIQSISTIKKTNIIKEVSNPTSITMTTITGTKVKIITNPVNNLIRIQKKKRINITTRTKVNRIIIIIINIRTSLITAKR